jgi:predicted transcriptional regulator
MKMSKVKPIERKVIYKKPREPIEGMLQVGDMVITDEFELVEPNATAQILASKLANNPNNALLVKSGEKVTGIVTEDSIIKAIADGKAQISARLEDLMTDDIVEINDDAALEDVLPELNECKPMSVIVVDKAGKFRGYFSPKDCEYATKRLKLHQG